jgi:chromosome segregation ATPase
MSEDPTKTFPPEGTNGLAEDVRSIKERLQQLEDKFDERSRETRPMSERIDQILVEVLGTRQELRDVNRTLRRMNVDIAMALRNQDEIEDQLNSLEERLPPP